MTKPDRADLPDKVRQDFAKITKGLRSVSLPKGSLQLPPRLGVPPGVTAAVAAAQEFVSLAAMGKTVAASEANARQLFEVMSHASLTEVQAYVDAHPINDLAGLLRYTMLVYNDPETIARIKAEVEEDPGVVARIEKAYATRVSNAGVLARAKPREQFRAFVCNLLREYAQGLSKPPSRNAAITHVSQKRKRAVESMASELGVPCRLERARITWLVWIKTEPGLSEVFAPITNAPKSKVLR